MSWPFVAIEDVAQVKSIWPKCGVAENVLQLTLDHIAGDTGQLLERNIKPLEKAGTSTIGFNEQHVLYSKLRPYLNKVYLPRETGIGTSELVPILPISNILDRSYLAHFLRSPSFVNWAMKRSTGAKMPRTNMKLFWQYKIPLPPLEEQKRIAAILDKADAIRRKREKAIELTDTLLRSTFLDMFGDPVTNPKGWEVKQLSQIVEGKYGIKAGPFGSALKKEEYVSSGYRVYGQEQVIGGDLNIGNYYINEEKFNSLKSCSVKSNDILVSLVGSFGRVLVVPKEFEPGIINPRLLKISLNPKFIVPLFLEKLLTSQAIQNQFLGSSHGGTMGILNAGKLKELSCIVPPLDLQRSFAKNVIRINELHRQFCKSKELTKTSLASLTQRAFRGELTTSDFDSLEVA